jgi:L-fucose mutarotase
LDIPPLLEAVLTLFPLDTYVDKPVALMAVVPGDTVKPTIWESYREIVRGVSEKAAGFDFLEREAFYRRARNAYAVVATSEKALYANVLLKKGVVA